MLSLLDRTYAAPIICRFCVLCVPVREAKFIRRTEFGIARTPVFRGFDKAERLAFTYCWGDSMPVDAIILEIFECHRQATVIVPTVMSQLNFKAREDTVARFA